MRKVLVDDAGSSTGSLLPNTWLTITADHGVYLVMSLVTAPSSTRRSWNPFVEGFVT